MSAVSRICFAGMGAKLPCIRNLFFVGIDQQSLQPDAVGAEEAAGNRALQLMLQKPYPWSREVWSLLMDQLFNSGARLVIFDIVFSSTNEGDAAFRAALDKYRDRVVIGMQYRCPKRQSNGVAERKPDRGSARHGRPGWLCEFLARCRWNR